ncbi:MAG: hypothetical protein GX262_01520 [Clostridia bacterium]|jgi:uncharacterized membrane protein|nr:hypothetical protein [Clostridia bacterium]
MYLVVSALAMTFTALLSDRLGARLLSYTALSMGTVTSVALCVLTVMGIVQEF